MTWKHVLTTFRANLPEYVNLLTVAAESTAVSGSDDGSLAEPEIENGERKVSLSALCRRGNGPAAASSLFHCAL